MASDWRGYCPFVVADQRFRWVCSFADPWAVWFDTEEERRQRSPDQVLVRPEDRPTRLLSVWRPVREGPVVTPGLVRACVEEAMRRGWPDASAALKIAGAEAPALSQERAAADPAPERRGV